MLIYSLNFFADTQISIIKIVFFLGLLLKYCWRTLRKGFVQKMTIYKNKILENFYSKLIFKIKYFLFKKEIFFLIIQTYLIFEFICLFTKNDHDEF